MAGLVSWGFFGFVKDRRVLLILAVCFIFWKMIVPVSVVQRIEMSRGDSSIDARYEMWNQALELISERPLLGYGIKSTPRLGITTAGHKEERVSLHNGYLELTLEQGGIGLGIFLIFFFICFRCGWRLYRSATEGFFKGLGLGFAGCVLAVLAGNVAGSYWFYLNVSGFYWTTFALVVRSLEIMNEPKLEEKRELLQPTASRKSAGFFKHHIDALLE